MRRILCVTMLSTSLLASPMIGAGSASAGMNEGIAAVTVGDYPKAITEFQPLAASGDAAAQYQLARIYLEGHGPANGVAQGIDLMNSAATGGYPEAQAQLGLMYAKGLGVPVDNAKAYEWLNKAIAALPDGTRRTIAEANRDAVVQRMGGKAPNTVVAAAPAATTTKTPDSTAKATTAAATTTTKTTTPVTTATKPTVTETAKTGTTAPAATTTNKTTTVAATTPAKPATTQTANAAATQAATPAKPAATQVASAPATNGAPEAAPASAAAPSGVRIQLASLPTEDLAWQAWKDLNKKYSAQLSDLKADVLPADLGTKGIFYRVYTGPFDTVAKAQERCAAMKAAGLDCLVIGKQ